MWDIERPMPRGAGAFLEHLGRDVKMPIKVELRLSHDDQVSTVLSVSHKYCVGYVGCRNKTSTWEK